LGAPHWRPDARAAFVGMSFTTTRAHLVRAALEAMALQTHDLATAFAADGARWTSLRIDGGMSANDWMAQDLADMLALPVQRPAFVETTALGAAMLAGLGAGIYGSLGQAAEAMRSDVREFSPKVDEQVRQARLDQWAKAMAGVL
jgi:glycerol kinase